MPKYHKKKTPPSATEYLILLTVKVNSHRAVAGNETRFMTGREFQNPIHLNNNPNSATGDFVVLGGLDNMTGETEIRPPRS